MPNPDGTPTAEETAAAVQEPKSLIDGAEAAPGTTQTPEEIAAAKEAEAAEEKRILEADKTTLSTEDQTKREVIEKRNEEKRLLETPIEQLSAEDKVKRDALVKAQEDAKKAAVTKGAPEKYTDFTVPDGVEVNQPILEEFKVLCKKQNRTQAEAQELVDLQVKHVQAIADGLLTEFNQTISAWKKETTEFLGPKFKDELVFAGKAIDLFCTPEEGKALRGILGTTGVGNHKEVAKFFIRVGKAVSEARFVAGSQQTGQKTDAQLFYGDTMKTAT